jgi:hypothetical protein
MVTSSKSAFSHYTPEASHLQVKNALVSVVFSHFATFVIWAKQAVLSSQKF